MEELISKLQYYLGQLGKEFLSSSNQRYSSSLFQKMIEVSSFISYLTGPLIEDKTAQEVSQIEDFIEARYNLISVPYIQYPNRVTNILYGGGISGGDTLIFSGVNEAPFDNKLYGRKNKQWVGIELPSTPIINQDVTNWNLSFSWGNHSTVGYLTTESDPIFTASPSFGITNSLINNWNQAHGWGDHSTAGYAMAANEHDPLTLGLSNGLSLSSQQLSLAAATISTAGAMSASDKTKLNSVVVHDPLTLGTANGLNLSDQELSLSLATGITAGAMSSSDKTKLDNLTNYTHPSGFTSAPTSPLNGANIISRVNVNSEGHVTGVDTRVLALSNLGVTKSALTVQSDSNITLGLTGTPATSLFEAVEISVGWTGELEVSRGGTGAASFTSGELLIGNGTDALTTISRSGIDTRTTFPSSAHTLGSHSGVSLTNPQNGNLLVYKNGFWTNSTLTAENISLTEVDPIFTAWRDSNRTANTFYSAPNGSSGSATFRTLVQQDIPNIYVRFDTNSQGLTSQQQANVLANIGAQGSFDTGNITTNTSVLTITDGTDRILGSSNLQISHTNSGWTDKTELTDAFIISNLEVDSHGHIINWTTRELTASDLGLSLSDANYIHIQNSPASVWTFEHGMNKKPSVTIIDSAGSMILAKITYIDLNNIEIDFDGGLTSGEAICN